jgi:hypothetical protein
MKENRTSKMFGVTLFFVIVTITLIECKKTTTNTPTTNTPTTNTLTTSEGYTSLSDFFTKNGVAMQTYTISGSAGGSFTSPQGTQVTIPANAFVTNGSTPVTGNLIIQFKDIYKKSDMLLSNMPTQTATGPLKSGGEFFIKVLANDIAVTLANGKNIQVQQPFMGQVKDTAMAPFVLAAPTGSINANPVWVNNPQDSNTVAVDPDSIVDSYVFSLYQYNNSESSGTWCNSDNSSYFAAYSQTNLTINSNIDITGYDISVFLVFTDINSMVHVYHNYAETVNANDFPYNYAPVGLKCTVVAIAEKSGNVYSSFTPITISANQTVNFNLTQTTTTAFKTALKALD